jgi:hypothetical protein
MMRAVVGDADAIRLNVVSGLSGPHPDLPSASTVPAGIPTILFCRRERTLGQAIVPIRGRQRTVHPMAASIAPEPVCLRTAALPGGRPTWSRGEVDEERLAPSRAGLRLAPALLPSDTRP